MATMLAILQLRNVLLDLEALLTETLLVEHVVGLIDDENLQLTGIKLAALNNVHAGARRADNDRTLDTCRSVDGARNGGLYDELRNELTNRLDDVLDLTRQLSSGCKDKGLGLSRLAVINS